MSYREILFNGAGGYTLVCHSDVVNMHDTRYVSFYETEPTIHGLAQAFGQAFDLKRDHIA